MIENKQGQRDHDGHDARAGRSPRKMKRMAMTSPMPTSRLCSTLCVVTWTSSVRWLKSLIFIPGRQELPLLDLFDLLLDGLGCWQRLLVLPHQHDALDDVVFACVPRHPARRSPAAADSRSTTLATC